MSSSAIQDFIAKGQGWSVGTGGISLGGSSSHFIGIDIGGSPVSLVRTSISTDSDDLLITIYSNTGFTGLSNPVPEVNRNDVFRGRKKPTFVTYSGVTSDPLLSENILIRTSLKSGRFEAINESQTNDTGIVLSSNRKYVIEFKNNSSQAATLDFSAVVYSPESSTVLGG